MGALRYRALQPVHEPPAVRQLRQGVIKRQALDFVLCGFALGDVARHGNPVRQAAGDIIHWHDIEFQPEYLAALFVIDQLRANRLRLVKRRANPVKLGALGQGALHQAGRLAKHLVAAVSGLPFKSIVDKYDARAGCVQQAGFSDQHNVIQVRNTGLQQQQLLLRSSPFADVAQVHSKPVLKRIGPQFQPFVQRGIKLFKLNRVVIAQRLADFIAHPVTRIVFKHAPDRLTQQRRAGALQQLFAFMIYVNKTAFAVKRGKGIGDAGQCCAQAHGQTRQLLRRESSFRQVLQNALYTDNVPGNIPNGFAERTHPQALAARRDDLHLFIKRHPVRQARMNRVGH